MVDNELIHLSMDDETQRNHFNHAIQLTEREQRMQIRHNELISSYQPRFPHHPELRLLLYNIQSQSNVGSIIRSCVAFGIKQIIVVKKRNDKLKTFGNMNTLQHVTFINFELLCDAMNYIQEQSFQLIGVEIDPTSIDITQIYQEIANKQTTSNVFHYNSVLVLGNESNGLNESIRSYCNRLIYIPQYTTGTASLNVVVAGSIIMHHFAVWAQYTAANIHGQKFIDNNIINGEGNNVQCNNNEHKQ